MSRRLDTERLTLCPPVAKDTGFVRRLISDPTVRAFLGGVPQNLVVDFTTDDDVWIVRTADCPIGMMSLGRHKDDQDHEVSYQFMPAVWGHGYAREALLRILDFAYGDRGLPRVIAETQKANLRSVALLQCVGMTEVATLERYGATQLIFAKGRPS